MPDRLSGKQGLNLGRTFLYAALTLVLSGCDTQRQGKAHEITGHLPDLRFSLMTDTGQAVTNQTYQGYLVMLFFGFTSCQAECPTTLFRLAKIMQILGNAADRTRILFVTLDPGRDNPQILHDYIKAFDARQMIGLTGTETQIEELARRYRAAYRPRKPDSDQLSHSTAIYVFDPEGKARLLITPDDSMLTVVDDLRRLLVSSR